MNVRITLHREPNRTYLHSNIAGPVESDWMRLALWTVGTSREAPPDAVYLMPRVAVIELDEDPGDFF